MRYFYGISTRPAMPFFKLPTIRNARIRDIFLMLILVYSMPARAQEQQVKELEQNVYRLNNGFKYDQSIVAIRNFPVNGKK